ncbi:hypothetical protein BBP40_008780 [Aspergillus hancockii]|nr:hypothetical protein BBP40_008780 [Aspergillus hancockii]
MIARGVSGVENIGHKAWAKDGEIRRDPARELRKAEKVIDEMASIQRNLEDDADERQKIPGKSDGGAFPSTCPLPKEIRLCANPHRTTERYDNTFRPYKSHVHELSRSRGGLHGTVRACTICLYHMKHHQPEFSGMFSFIDCVECFLDGLIHGLIYGSLAWLPEPFDQRFNPGMIDDFRQVPSFIFRDLWQRGQFCLANQSHCAWAFGFTGNV